MEKACVVDQKIDNAVFQVSQENNLMLICTEICYIWDFHDALRR